MATCERPHRWGGFRRVGPGAIFLRRCRRRACPVTETVIKQANETLPPGLALRTTRRGQPFLYEARRVRA
jgi:hypothetical protein